MKRLALLSASALASIVVVALAQPQPGGPADIKKMLNARTEQVKLAPEQHDALAMLVGDFDTASEVNMGGPEPLKARGRTSGRWILGERFVQVDGKSAPDEELKGERMIVYGFDAQASKYTMWQVESASLTAVTATGTYDAASKTFTFEGERDAGPAGKVGFRWTMRAADDGSLDQKIAFKAPGATDFAEVVTVKHTRTKGAK